MNDNFTYKYSHEPLLFSLLFFFLVPLLLSANQAQEYRRSCPDDMAILRPDLQSCQ